MKLRRHTAAFAAIATLALFGVLAVTAPARAEPEGCLPNVGKKVPVILVHGFNAGADIWGDDTSSGSFVSKINALPNTTATTINYRPFSLSWVTDPNIGPALAAKILCSAASSRQQGGAGKVVVVAHSMGGLATRQAIASSPEAAQAVGMVITIATPNTGSDFSRQALEQALSLCNVLPTISQGCASALSSMMQALNAIPALATGSPELAALPGWPASLPVYAIAGNIRPHYGLFDLGFDGQPSGTDTLVTTASALHGNAVNGLGGTKEFVCTGDSAIVLMGLTRATCEHGALVNDPGVQALVANTIRGYVSQLTDPRPNPTPTTTNTSAKPTAPKPSTTPTQATDSSCPPDSIKDQAINQYDAAKGYDRSNQLISTVCKNGWAVIRIRTPVSSSGNTLRAYIVLQRTNNTWRVLATGDGSVCQQLPADMRYGMCA